MRRPIDIRQAEHERPGFVRCCCELSATKRLNKEHACPTDSKSKTRASPSERFRFYFSSFFCGVLRSQRGFRKYRSLCGGAFCSLFLLFLLRLVLTRTENVLSFPQGRVWGTLENPFG